RRHTRSYGDWSSDVCSSDLLASRAGEMRLPVDWRRPLSHPRASFVGPDRPLPPRPAPLGLAQELGKRETDRVTPRVRAGVTVAQIGRASCRERGGGGGGG